MNTHNPPVFCFIVTCDGEPTAKDTPAKDAPAKDTPAKDVPAKDTPAKDPAAGSEPGKDSAASNEKVYPNFKEWVADFETRLKPLEEDIKVKPTDDAYAKSKKNWAASYVNNYVKKRLLQKEQQLARNDAWTMSWQHWNEYYMNAAGRSLYGAQWSVKRCGAGYISYPAGCGSKSA